MNARKYAWKLLHAEIRRQAGPDEGLELHPQFYNQGVLIREARDAGFDEYNLLMEAVKLGATFALLSTQNDPISFAADLGRRIMAEPDEDDDEDDDDQ